jgi:hypothetical protein
VVALESIIHGHGRFCLWAGLEAAQARRRGVLVGAGAVVAVRSGLLVAAGRIVAARGRRHVRALGNRTVLELLDGGRRRRRKRRKKRRRKRRRRKRRRRKRRRRRKGCGGRALEGGARARHQSP